MIRVRLLINGQPVVHEHPTADGWRAHGDGDLTVLAGEEAVALYWNNITNILRVVDVDADTPSTPE
jgi:hypothetical protein